MPEHVGFSSTRQPLLEGKREIGEEYERWWEEGDPAEGRRAAHPAFARPQALDVITPALIALLPTSVND